MIVAIAGFFRVDELRRFARVRRSALVLALVALAGVLVLGVLPGLLIAAALSLVWLMRRLGRPELGTLARDPASGAWGRADRHTGWATTPGVIVAAAEGPLFYANALTMKDRLLAAVEAAHPRPTALVLDLSRNDEIDVNSLDMLADLADALAREGVELRLAAVHAPVLELLRRDGLGGRVRLESTLDAAVRART